MGEFQRFIEWEAIHELEIIKGPDTQYDVIDALAEQIYLRKLGASENDLSRYGEIMMDLVERMEAYTDQYRVIGLGHASN